MSAVLLIFIDPTVNLRVSGLSRGLNAALIAAQIRQ
jgi:hypothetical protein